MIIIISQLSCCLIALNECAKNRKRVAAYGLGLGGRRPAVVDGGIQHAEGGEGRSETRGCGVMPRCVIARSSRHYMRRRDECGREDSDVGRYFTRVLAAESKCFALLLIFFFQIMYQ